MYEWEICRGRHVPKPTPKSLRVHLRPDCTVRHSQVRSRYEEYVMLSMRKAFRKTHFVFCFICRQKHIFVVQYVEYVCNACHCCDLASRWWLLQSNLSRFSTCASCIVCSLPDQLDDPGVATLAGRACCLLCVRLAGAQTALCGTTSMQPC